MKLKNNAKKSAVNSVLEYMKKERNFDFSGFHHDFIENRIDNRIKKTECSDFHGYLRVLEKNPDECGNLIDNLIINTSEFFRHGMTYEFLFSKIIPILIHNKSCDQKGYIRIWSAGCSTGEEPYSIAILLDELLSNNFNMNLFIFATDIDEKSLNIAESGVYSIDQIQNIKYGLVRKHFIKDRDSFKLISDIKNMVKFSHYDLTDDRTYAPEESVFGNFDMILCRNVLIYYNVVFQDIIFSKLYRSLAPEGYLVLGEAERPSLKYQNHYRRLNKFCHIYQKA